MSYETPYFATPIITRKGGKVIKQMTKSTQTEAPKASKKYAKTRGEHYKDIVIAILVTAIVAFGLGVKIQADRNAEVAQAVKNAVAPTAEAVPAPASK